MQLSIPTAPVKASPSAQNAALHAKAAELEAAFLSQMLAHAGFDQAMQGLGGGDGAQQFTSFLRDAEAQAMVRAGGIGLTESLFRAMAGQMAAAGGQADV